MGFDELQLLLIGHNYFLPPEPPQGHAYERWFYADGKGEARNQLYNTRLEPECQAAQTWHSGLPVEWHNSTWIGDQTIEYIQQSRDKPFCLWASFPDPHHPFDAPDPWSRLHHPDEVDLPEHRTRDFDRRPWWHRAAIENKPTGPAEWANIRQVYSRIDPQDDYELRELIANYYGMISLIDHNVGRIMTALEEVGLTENTIVVYSSDHGDWLGDHGLILKGPMHYEGLLRIGLIMRGPGIPAGAAVEDPVSTLDLPPTFLDYGRASAQLTQHGASLRPLLETADGSRDFALNEWDLNSNRAGVELTLRTVRTKTHKLTLELGSGAGELYDLGNDPGEMDNRFNDPGLQAVQKELADMIASRPSDAREQRSVPSGTA